MPKATQSIINLFGLTHYQVRKKLECFPQIFSQSLYEWNASQSSQKCFQLAMQKWQLSFDNTARLRPCYPRKNPCHYQKHDKPLEFYDITSNLAEATRYLKKDYKKRSSLQHSLTKLKKDANYSTNQKSNLPIVQSQHSFRSSAAFQINLGLLYLKAKKENALLAKSRCVQTNRTIYFGNGPSLGGSAEQQKTNYSGFHCGVDLFRLAIMRSNIQGFGVFALQSIPSSVIVVEYIGELIGKKTANDREKYYDAHGIGCYFFKLDESLIIDATMKGNSARYINHSCEPNCYATVCTVEGCKKVVLIVTARVIAPLEELSYDYKFSMDHDGVKIPCHCNSKKCRGFMN